MRIIYIHQRPAFRGAHVIHESRLSLWESLARTVGSPIFRAERAGDGNRLDRSC